MRKLILLCISLTIGLAPVYAQNKIVDSLLTALDNHPEKDSMQTAILEQLGKLYTRNNNKKAVEYFTRAIVIAPGVRADTFISDQYVEIGYLYYDDHNYDKALENFLAAVQILEKSTNSRKLSHAYLGLGNVFTRIKNFEKARSYFIMAESIITKNNDVVREEFLYSGLGNYYYELQMFDSAAYVMKKSLRLAQERKDFWSEMGMSMNMGLMYKKIGKMDSSLVYVKKAEAIAKRENIMGDVGDVIYNNLASVYSESGQFATAKPYFDSSIAYSKQFHNLRSEMENYLNLADMYGRMKDYEKQSRYLQMHYTLKDSVFTQDKNNQITQMEADYVVNKKSAEVLEQQAEVTRQRNSRNLFILFTSFAILAAAGIFYFYLRMKKTNRTIRQQKDELQKLNDIKNRLFGIISHDLRNPLVTLRSYLSLSDDPSLSAEKQVSMKNRTREVVTQTTDMLDNLLVWAGSQIKDNGVQIQHTDITEVVQDSIDTVSLQAQQKNIIIRLNEAVESMALADKNLLSIVCRNLLTNAVKFTPEGGQININVQKKDDHIAIAFTDTGVGMSKQLVHQLQEYKVDSGKGTNNEKGTGLGIFLVKELVQKMKGRLLVQSTEGKGSVFTVVLETA
jgi:two-component system, sensor histidine kinase and response regulator